MVDEPRITSCISFDVRFISMLANISVVIEASQGFYVLTYTSLDVSYLNLSAYDIGKFCAGLAKCVEIWSPESQSDGIVTLCLCVELAKNIATTRSDLELDLE